MKFHHFKKLILLVGILYIPEVYATECYHSRQVYHYEIKECPNRQGNYIASTEQGVGLLNQQGQEVIPFIYSEIEYYQDGVAIAKNKSSDYGLLDEYGKVVAPFQYEFIGKFKENLAPASRMMNNKEKWGYLNNQGKEIIPFIYDSVYYFTDGLALVELNGKFYQLDKKGRKKEIKQKFEISHVLSLNEDLIVISNDKNNERYYGVINHAGKIIVPTEYDEVDIYRDILRAEKDNGETDYYSQKGGKIDDYQETSAIEKLKNGYLLFVEESKDNTSSQKYGVMNNLGKIIIPAHYDNIGMLEESFIAYKGRERDENNEVFLFNNQGDLLYKTKNTEIISYYSERDGYAVIEQKVIDKNTDDIQVYYGLIKYTGEIVVPIQYREINWSHHYLEVKNDKNQIALIDKNNRIIIDFNRYDEIREMERNMLNPLFKVKKDQHLKKSVGIGEIITYYGVVNEQGVEVLAPIYDEITVLDNFIKIVKITDGRRKTGLFSIDMSKHILATEYEEIDKIEHSPYFKVKSLTGHFGLVDTSGKVIIDMIYDDIQQIATGYILIKDRKWGILDKKGQWILPLSQDLELVDVPALFKK